ncbi:tetratricopeptide repeat protein [Streptomyces sp. TRM68367]|uniref:tetratricopeptide repeat protein n=1 Tax=Streptomyces sp. TRM68367 TaxID=2758415 RepID=UPI00165B73BF|nr:tetratricopeptide repeat protein [Streptomyces sp. TRM68367]MBC9724227.1 tetratricopeptide repeat protein [Streptomyces sp. TRM68367]
MAAPSLDDNLRRQAHRALRQGDFVSSVHLYAQILDRPPTGPDVEDSDTLQARADYALALNGLAHYTRGEVQLQHALQGQKCLLGPDHPATLTTMARLADNLGEQRRRAQAYELAHTTVDRALRTLGADHPVALTARLSLARAMLRTRPYEAEPVARAALRDIDKALGDQHCDSWAARHLLVGILRAVGKLEEAEAVARDVITTRRRYQGATHPHTLQAQADLALILRAVGRTDQAEAVIRAVLAVSTWALGTEHPCTIRFRIAGEAITK